MTKRPTDEDKGILGEISFEDWPRDELLPKSFYKEYTPTYGGKLHVSENQPTYSYMKIRGVDHGTDADRYYMESPPKKKTTLRHKFLEFFRRIFR